MEQFISYLHSVSPLKKESKTDFLDKCQIFEFPKGHYLTKAGEISHFLYFIVYGLGKVYYLKDGRELIDWIGEEGNLLTSVTSFLTQLPSKHYVQLLEDSKLIGISYSNLQNLFGKHHDIERLGRQLSVLALVQIEQRIHSMHFESAKQRYNKFLNDFPNCINRISLGDLASYLGMTQVTLSRVRRQK